MLSMDRIENEALNEENIIIHNIIFLVDNLKNKKLQKICITVTKINQTGLTIFMIFYNYRFSSSTASILETKQLGT